MDRGRGFCSWSSPGLLPTPPSVKTVHRPPGTKAHGASHQIFHLVLGTLMTALKMSSDTQTQRGKLTEKLRDILQSPVVTKIVCEITAVCVCVTEMHMLPVPGTAGPKHTRVCTHTN